MWKSHFHSPWFVSWLWNRKAVFLIHEWYNSVCYTFGFPLSYTANCFYAELWVDFLDKPYMGGQKIHFLWCGLLFSLNFCLFKTKVPIRWRVNGPIKKQMPYLDSPHSNTSRPYEHQFLLFIYLLFIFIYLKILATEKHCTHLVSVMWVESFEVVFLGGLFHWF